MKLIWIGAFALVFVSLASLVSNHQSGKLINESWTTASSVLRNTELSELQRTSPVYAAKVFAGLPVSFRQKIAAKTWQPLELMIFRCLVLWHVAPATLIALVVGFLEGSWARANQKALVKVHSPMRFSLALMSLAFIPVLALLWVAAPLAIPATLPVFGLGTVGIISTRNLVVHAATQF